jgi:hypothetical protein
MRGPRRRPWPAPIRRSGPAGAKKKAKAKEKEKEKATTTTKKKKTATGIGRPVGPTGPPHRRRRCQERAAAPAVGFGSSGDHSGPAGLGPRGHHRGAAAADPSGTPKPPQQKHSPPAEDDDALPLPSSSRSTASGAQSHGPRPVVARIAIASRARHLALFFVASSGRLLWG